MAVAGVVLVLGVAAVAVNVRGDDEQTVTYAAGEVPALEGRWTAAVFSDLPSPEKVRLQLEEIDEQIERQQIEIDRTGGAGDRAIQQQAVLGNLLQQRAALMTTDTLWAEVFIDFREDGTLGGFDGCDDFGGHWTARRRPAAGHPARRLGALVPSVPDSGLQELLGAAPTVSVPTTAPGDLELRAGDRYVTFDRATGPKAVTDTELTIDLDAGVAKVTFRTPRTLERGRELRLAPWSAVSSSDQPVPVWVAAAIEGLPAGCDLGGPSRWEDLEGEIADGGWESLAGEVLLPGTDGRTGQIRADVPAGCAGEYTLVLLFGADGRLAQERVPITIA